MRERLARILDPDAFDRLRFDAMADVNTRAGDFERGQQRVYERLDAILAELREPDPGMIMAGHSPLALGTILDPTREDISEAFTAMIDHLRGT